MRVFAPVAFRYPALSGKDYPYGYQDIADETLVGTLITAGYLQRTDAGPDPTVPPGGAIAVLSRLQENQGAVGPLAADANDNVLSPGGLHRFNARARANSTFSKYGVTAFDFTRTDITIGLTSVTRTLANERPGFQPYTQKCVINASSGAQIRFTSLSYTADQSQNSFAVRVFIEQMVSEFNAPNNGFITIQISNSTSLGSNYSRWTFDATCIKQGWNILKVFRDDTVSSTAGTGNLPVGVAHPADVGTGFDWTGTGQYVAISFDNMNGNTVHIDEWRRPAKAISTLTMGFDANGASNTDDVLVNKVAPMFAAIGLRSYVTLTNIYEMISAGPTVQAWARIATLQDKFGWSVVNHTWSHGATAIGRVTLASTSMTRASNVVTVNWAGGHGLPVKKVLKAALQGSTPSDMSGVFDITVVDANNITYTAAGADGTASVQAKLYTFLSEVLNANNVENLRLLRKEVTDIQKAARASGLTVASSLLFMPNNSVPDMDLLSTVCAENGIRYVRAYRGGFTPKDELGLENPLHMGSFVLDSGAATFTRLSVMKAKFLAALARGDDIHYYGHFLVDNEDPANAAFAQTVPDFPPGQGGNPNPPAGVSLSGFGGWWYLSDLRAFIDFITPYVVSGQVRLASPAEYAALNG